MNTLSTNQILDIAEDALELLVQTSKTKYSQRCSSQNTQCDIKLYDECSDFAPELTCEQDFPFSQQCSVDGAFLSWETNAGRCQTNVSCDSQLDREIQCSQASLFDSPSLKHDSTSPIVYQYVGFYNSFRTIYPYQHAKYNQYGQCKEYDPRYRPWYVGAASGPKNVILIIDISGTMNNYGRLESAKTAANAVINTLGVQDYFGIVYFSDTASKYTSRLVQATDGNKQSAISLISSLEGDGKTNYEDAFREAFDMLKSTIDSELGSVCFQNIMLFLTDGQPTVGIGEQERWYDTEQEEEQADINSANALLPFIDGLNTGPYKSVIFTYALGGDTRSYVLEKIACQYDGIFYEIEDAGSESLLLNQMRSYYDYLAMGMNTEQIIWSEIYADFITGKDFITASKPIFILQGDIKILLGVAGVDIDMDSIKNNSGYESEVRNRQNQSRMNACSDLSDLEVCQFYLLRGEKVCPGEVLTENCDDYEGNFEECVQTITANPWVSSYPQDSDGNIIQYTTDELTACCPDKTQQKPVDANIISYSLILLIFIQFIII